MARPLTRDQCVENDAFLQALARSGNVRLAARAVGVAYGTIQHRRRAHPAFATRWDAALAAGQARLNRRGPYRPNAGSPSASLPAGGLRTAGGEPVVVRLGSGKLQVRAAQPGKLTRACEQAFLLALSATANVRLSAAAAGAAEAAFFRRRRRDPGFAREMRMALQAGYQRLEEALIAGFLPEDHRDDAWRLNDAPALPRMNGYQALQLLYLHQKEVKLPWGAASFRPRKTGVEGAVRDARIDREYAERIKRQAEDTVTRGLDALARRLAPGEAPVVLPDLDQVAAAQAGPAGTVHGAGALFGGWRIEQLTPAQREDGRRKGRERRG